MNYNATLSPFSKNGDLQMKSVPTLRDVTAPPPTKTN